MHLIVNGEQFELRHPSPNIVMLLDAMSLQGQRVAVEVNQNIVPKSEHESHVLQAQDKIEVVRAIGGG